MDFNLPEPVQNNYSQTLSNPLPAQLSIDQLTKQSLTKTHEGSPGQLINGLDSNVVLPEATVIAERKKKKDDEK